MTISIKHSSPRPESVETTAIPEAADNFHRLAKIEPIWKTVDFLEENKNSKARVLNSPTENLSSRRTQLVEFCNS